MTLRCTRVTLITDIALMRLLESLVAGDIVRFAFRCEGKCETDTLLICAVAEEVVAECDRLATCPFFIEKMPTMAGVADWMKKTYCLGNKTLCARYQVISADITAPPDLYPNDTPRSQQILQGQ